MEQITNYYSELQFHYTHIRKTFIPWVGNAYEWKVLKASYFQFRLLQKDRLKSLDLYMGNSFFPLLLHASFY